MPTYAIFVLFADGIHAVQSALCLKNQKLFEQSADGAAVACVFPLVKVVNKILESSVFFSLFPDFADSLLEAVDVVVEEIYEALTVVVELQHFGTAVVQSPSKPCESLSACGLLNYLRKTEVDKDGLLQGRT